MSTARPRHGRPPRGLYVVVAGPDGAGKTTVVEHVSSLSPPGRPVLHLHHRPRVLGGMTTPDGPVTEPHRDPPYPRWLSTAKLVFLWLDHLVGWWWRLRPHLRGGGDVLLERGWWDLEVDPRRYRLRPHPRLVRVLGRLLPGPAVTLVLVADADVLAGRTTELGRDELAVQVAAWRAVPTGAARARRIDVGRDLATVLQDVEAAVTSARHPLGWAGLPTADRPRWLLPRGPRRAAANALRVYTPVTIRGIAGWLAMRVLVHLGAARLLPRTAPPTPALRRIADLLPPGGTIAVGHGTHPGRSVVLVLDATGRPATLAKLADDADGVAALATEAESVAWARPLLPAALGAPRLISSRDGRLDLEAIRWSPRLRPWILPADVAAALGTFFATGGDGTSGPSHGDCAPWNLLRSPDGWHLVDWADADRAAPAFTDPWHYVVQAHALLGRPSRRAVLAGLDGRGWVGAALAAYADAAGLALADARPALAGYLDSTVRRMDTSRPDGRRGLAARQALQRELQATETR